MIDLNLAGRDAHTGSNSSKNHAENHRFNPTASRKSSVFQGLIKRNQDAIGEWHGPLVGTLERGGPATVIFDWCRTLGGCENAAPRARRAEYGAIGDLPVGARLSANQGLAARIRTRTNGGVNPSFSRHFAPFL
jgi:hypothetical protein